MSDEPVHPDPSPYAGRWVALVRGKIVAQGETREQAFQAARFSRRKEQLDLRFMPVMPVSSPLLDAVCALLPAEVPAYLVGGAVRDAVLGRVTHDLDFATPQGLKLAKKIANGLPAAFFPLDEAFDTARVVLIHPDGTRDVLDFAGYRGETLEADLQGRDFTLNALAMDLQTGAVIDPLGGLKDLREKRIRACSATSLSDDPVRILRAVRQAAALGFAIDPETRQQMKAAVPLLTKISPERQRDELFKILEGPKPDAALRALELLGVFPALLPELAALKGVEQSAPHVHDVWAHTLAVLRHLEGILSVLAPEYDEVKANADVMNGLLVMRLGRYRQQISAHLGSTLNTDRSARSLLFFAALYHDVNKPQTKTTEESGRIRFLGHDEQGAETACLRGQALHLSNDELTRLKLIIRHHMRVHAHSSRQVEGQEMSRKAIYRFFRDCGEAGVDLILLALADTRATYDQTLTQVHWTSTLDVCRTLLEAWYEKAEEVVRPAALVNGNDLINELNLKPGPEIGSLLEAIRETQAAGNLSTREEALSFARGWLVKAAEAGSEK
jgi:tRNA nucleotidyltransferase/poly(A) polymerase